MEELQARFDRLEALLSDRAFLENRGLSNEVGLHVFAYPPEEEEAVTDLLRQLGAKQGTPFRIVECDLYRIFLDICEEKRILDKIPDMEARRGREALREQLQRIATPQLFVRHMEYAPHQPGDVLVITGVGRVYPFTRAHSILENLQHLFRDIPVVLFYPGVYNGQSLHLFDKFQEANYYRAFNMI